MRISDWSSDVCSSDLESNADQITVCARKGENERFRIPEALREDPNAPGNESWTNRAVAMEYVGRSGTDSCSPVGGGGFTGCFSELMREARADRMGSDNISWARLVEAERQKRQEKLDAEAAAIEAKLKAEEQQSEGRRVGKRGGRKS